MASNPPSFSFGETWSLLHADLQRQVNRLSADVRALQTERQVARAANDALIRAGAAAETAKAEAERKLGVVEKLFKSLREHHLACPGTMDTTMGDADAHDRGVELEEENARFKEEVKQLQDDRIRLQSALADKAKESEAKEEETTALRRRNDELTKQSTELKAKLEQETKDAADIRTNLDTAYADLTRKVEEHRTLRKQKEDIEAQLVGANLQLEDAHDHFQQSQLRVEELESQQSAVEALEREHATLQADTDDMQVRLNDHDRTVLVKDARIAYLETQVQKALEAAARAQDEQNKADAAVDPTAAEPTSVLTTGGSLEDEFNEIDDGLESETASQLELSLELVTAVTTAQTAPVDASTTTSSTQTAVSPAQAVTSFTQTDVSTTGEVIPIEPSATLSESDIHVLWKSRIEPALRNLSTSSPRTIDLRFIIETVQDLTGSALTTASTQTEPPKLTHTGTSTSSATYEERHTQTNTAEPVIHEERSTQTEAPKLKQTGTSTILDQPPVVQEDRHTQTDGQAPPTVVYVPKKRSVFSFSTALAIFFALLAMLYYAELESWKNSSNRAGVNRLYNSMGYQRRGRHILGTIPVCYEQGETWLGEALCQQFAAGIQKIEARLGIEYPSRW